MSLFRKRLGSLAAVAIAVVAAAVVALPAPGRADETCTQDQLSAAIDSAGEKLRELTSATQPTLQAKLLKLKQAKGWSDQEAEQKGYAALEDERTAKLDAAANQLLARLDTLGGNNASTPPDCARIAEVEAVGLELQATVRAKSQYVLARLDQLTSEASTPAAAATQPPVAPSAAPHSLPPPAKAPERPAAPAVASNTLPATTPPLKAAPAPKPDRWATQTTTPVPSPVAPPPAAQLPATPPPVVAAAPPSLPPANAPAEDGYTIDEIVAASHGVFGKLSANLARVLEHAFAKSGRPSGYILGQETGGAFIAGLRYGSGTLYLRSGGTLPIHWHGPSLGADVGAQGAATLFLVYRVKEPADMFSNFTGIEGSAFVVGGLGMTFMSNGHIDMAPIRSGIGLRLGANLGYIRFTSKPTWNPF